MGNLGLTFLGVLLFLTSTFMMMLILVQRGKGGGLTGALGGMGGQSAFGAKAGDVFTKITIVTAIIWITLCMITIAAFNPPPSNAGLNDAEDVSTMSSGDEEEATTGEGDAAAADESNSDSDSNNEITPEDLEEELKDLIQDGSNEQPAADAGSENNMEESDSDGSGSESQPAEDQK